MIPRAGSPESVRCRHEAREAIEVSFELWLKRVMRVFALVAAELVDQAQLFWSERRCMRGLRFCIFFYFFR